MKRKWKQIAGYGLVGTLAALPFLQTYLHGLLNLDDYQYTVGCAFLTDAPLVKALSWLLTSTSDAIWMPVTRLTYLVDCRVFGESAGAMHLHNVFYHVLNALLLARLLQLLVTRRCEIGAVERGEGPTSAGCSGGPSSLPLMGPVIVATLFWALHPLRVEPVAWIASRKDLVSLCFELLALIAWLRRLDYVEGSHLRTLYFGVAMGSFILAGMAKPVAMTFPVLAGLLEWLLSRRVSLSEYTAPAVIACLIGGVAQQVQTAGGGSEALSGVPLAGRLLNAISALGIYCWNTIWPSDLAVQCLHRWPELPRFWWQSLLICALLAVTLFFSFRRSGFSHWLCSVVSPAEKGVAPPIGNPWSRVVFVSLCFFGVAVAPMLGLANFGIHAFADRFTYLPAIGFSILLCFLLHSLFNELAGGTTARFLAQGALAVGLATLAAQTYRQTHIWSSEDKLLLHTLDVDGPSNHFVRGSLGLHYWEFEGDLEKALVHFDYAFAKKRGRELSSYHFIYIEVLAESGDLVRARAEAKRYLEDREELARELQQKKGGAVLSDGMSYLVYAILQLAEGDTETAQEHLDAFERLFPNTPHVAYLRGKRALACGDARGAIRYWKESLADTRIYNRHRFVEKQIRKLEQELIKNRGAGT